MTPTVALASRWLSCGRLARKLIRDLLGVACHPDRGLQLECRDLAFFTATAVRYSAEPLHPTLKSVRASVEERAFRPALRIFKNKGSSPGVPLFCLLCVLVALLFSPPAFAAAERGVMVRVAQIYLSPDPNSQKMGLIDRGREVAVLERSREWAKVYASITPEQDITGWMLDKGIVTASTPNGDKILFGEAVDSESEASRRRGRKGAAQDAMRLYARMAEYFPNSPLAPEAFYRAADVRWQLDREDIMSRPSAKMVDPSLRQEIDPEAMHKVMKKYPHTKWADLAAYHLIENKLCGQWDGTPKCPEKESDLYEKYASEHPDSPVAPESLYEAAWRRAALIDIYQANDEGSKSGDARNRATALAEKITGRYPQTDWAARAQRLIFYLQQNIPTYGNVVQ